jgi:NTP pyrophosphatase (non-canonical NTP hydrolase)
MPDDLTTIREMRDLVARFVGERDWERFHTPKNLAMALAIEVAEVMEHFQWLTPPQAQAIATDPDRKAAVGEELADVACYLLALANSLDLDLSDAILAKMKKNEAKYPAGEFRGRFGNDDPGTGTSGS